MPDAEADRAPLAQAFNRAVADHFAAQGRASVRDVSEAAVTVLAAYLGAVPDPAPREELLGDAIGALVTFTNASARDEAARAGKARS